jgi:thioesterase domain-containing protein
VPLQPAGDRPPIFLAAGSGGGVRRFQELADQFAPSQPVYGLESRNIALAGKAFTIEAVASEFLSAIRAVQPVGPYLLGGYSLGGLIALEMARMLVRVGERVGPLLMLDCYGAPEFSTALGRYRAVFEHFFNLNFTQKRKFIAERCRLLKSRLFHRLGVQPEEVRSAETTRRQEDTAAQEYVSRVQPYNGQVFLIFASQRLATAPKHELGGWRGLLRGRLHTRTIPGTHYELLDKQNATSVVQAISAILPKDVSQSPSRLP